jgi:hypothetical protein
MRNAMRLLGFVAAAAFVIATANPASAACVPNKTAATFGPGLTSVYWTPAGAVNEGSLTGQFWQLGNRASANEGACLPALCGGSGGWLYFYTGKLSLNAIMGSPEAAGCPTGTMIVVAQANSTDGKSAFFVAGTANESTTGGLDFNYATLGDHALVQVPRPRVLSSSRAANIVTLHVNVPDAAAGSFGPSPAITGYRLVSGNGVGTTDSGRDGATYQTLQSFTAPQADVVQTIDCAGIVAPNDKFVGIQVLFDAGASQTASRVGATYRVGCDPALATPKTPIVPKKGPGVRQVAPTQN